MESLESFASQESHQDKAEEVFKVRQEIQSALIIENAPFKGDSKKEQDEFNEYVFEWIEGSSDKFKKAFESLMEENPKLVEDWQNNSSLVLDQIKLKMSEGGSRAQAA